MKKQVALLTTALLATSFVLGATSCASKDTNKLMVSQVSTKESTQNVSALWNDNAALDTDTMDNNGLVVALSGTTDTDDNLTSKTYKLYDLKTNAPIAGASVTVSKPGETALSYVDYDMDKIADGFYYSAKMVRQCPHVPEGQTAPNWTLWPLQAANINTYTLYGKNGVVAENLKGLVNTSNGTFTTNEGEVYYVDVNGDVKSRKDPLAKYMTATSNYSKVGDYYYDYIQSGLCNIYDANGNYLRNFDIYTEFEMPMVYEYTTWSVGNRLFVQYIEMLPENEKKYDLEVSGEGDGAQKYNVTTKYYDLEKEKVKEVDFDYFVQEEVSANDNDDVAVLYINEIKDKKMMRKTLVQSFDEKGNVAIDLQKLVPGATDYSYNKTNDYVKLSDGDMDYICQGKEVIGKFPTGKVRYTNNVACALNSNGSFLYIYNLSGTVAKAIELENVAEGLNGYEVLMNGDIVYESDGGVTVYDTRTKDALCVASSNDATVVVDAYNGYVKTTKVVGEKTSVTYAFLIGQIGDITLDSDNYERVQDTSLQAVRLQKSVLYWIKGDPKEAEGATEEKPNVYSSYYVSMPIVK